MLFTMQQFTKGLFYFFISNGAFLLIGSYSLSLKTCATRLLETQHIVITEQRDKGQYIVLIVVHV